MTKSLRDSSMLVRRPAQPTTIAPASLAQLMRVMDGAANVALPIRPRGASSATTDCYQASTGTTVEMLALNRIRHIDTYNHTSLLRPASDLVN